VVCVQEAFVGSEVPVTSTVFVRRTELSAGEDIRGGETPSAGMTVPLRIKARTRTGTNAFETMIVSMGCRIINLLIYMRYIPVVQTRIHTASGVLEPEGTTVDRPRQGRQHRYIGFTVEAPYRPAARTSPRALSEAGRIAPGGPVQFNLTVFDGRRGIVKVPHTKKEAAIAALLAVKFAGRDRSPVKVATVVTSGTICTVKARMGIPEGPKPWERKRGRTGEPQSRPAGDPVRPSARQQ